MTVRPMAKALPRMIEEALAPGALASRGGFRFGALAVYARVGPRSIGREMRMCVQIASIHADGGDASGRGLLTGMVAEIRGMTDLPIYVEGASTPGLVARLAKLGFTPARRVEDSDLPQDWVRLA